MPFYEEQRKVVFLLSYYLSLQFWFYDIQYNYKMYSV